MAIPNSKTYSSFNPNTLLTEQDKFRARFKGNVLQKKYEITPNFVFEKEHILGLFDENDTQLEVFLAIENNKLHIYLQAQGPGGGTGDPGGSAAGSPKL